MSTFVERLLGGKAGTVVTVEPDWIVINDGVSLYPGRRCWISVYVK